MLPFLLLLAGNETWVFIIPILLVIMLLPIKRTFTESVRIDGAHLEIRYIKYFRKRIIRLNTSNTILIVRDYYDVILNMSGRPLWFSILDVVENNKVKYKISTREGYTKETIMNFLHAIRNEKMKVRHNC